LFFFLQWAILTSPSEEEGKKKTLKLWRLPKIDVSIGRQSASPLAHLYIMWKGGERIWDLSVMVLRTTYETHWELQEFFGHLMGTHWY
jgi:hypothetical protein